MPQWNDCKFEALRNQGFQGSIDDMEIQWLQSNGATSNQVNDAWREFLIGSGVTPGAYNDMMMEWLGSLGYAGARNDREIQFWCDAGGVVGPGITRATIYDDARDEVEICFNGTSTSTSYACRRDGWTYTINGGAPQAFTALSPGDAPNAPFQCQRYVAASDFSPGDVVEVQYAGNPPGCIQVGGEDLPATSRNVDNQIVDTPQFVSGRVYESAGAAYVEITFNVAMTYIDFNGVTIRADTAPRAITAISGIGTNKVTYTTSGINSLNTVTWEYVQASGNLENLSGDPLPDVPAQTLDNQYPAQTLWDVTAGPPQDATTFWDQPRPDETKWDWEG